MRWLALWLLLSAVYLAALLACRLATGNAPFGPGDLPALLAVPAVEVAALAALAATAAPRRDARQAGPREISARQAPPADRGQASEPSGEYRSGQERPAGERA
jgi:hypothetical protein